MLHRDISSGNILSSDQVVGGGILHDFDYSEVVPMPGENLESNSTEEISRSLKIMTVSRIYYFCDGFKRFLARVLINSWRIVC